MENTFFLAFPQKVKLKERCLQWIRACNRPHWQLNLDKLRDYNYVCSQHFVGGNGPTKKYTFSVGKGCATSCSCKLIFKLSIGVGAEFRALLLKHWHFPEVTLFSCYHLWNPLGQKLWPLHVGSIHHSSLYKYHLPSKCLYVNHVYQTLSIVCNKEVSKSGLYRLFSVSHVQSQNSVYRFSTNIWSYPSIFVTSLNEAWSKSLHVFLNNYKGKTLR